VGGVGRAIEGATGGEVGAVGGAVDGATVGDGAGEGRRVAWIYHQDKQFELPVVESGDWVEYDNSFRKRT